MPAGQVHSGSTYCPLSRPVRWPDISMVPFLGRPAKELYAMAGAFILQQMLNLTDEETIRQFAFDIQWHYVLNIIEESDSAKYISLKTLWNLRKIVTWNHLEKEIFSDSTAVLARAFNVNTELPGQRDAHSQAQKI